MAKVPLPDRGQPLDVTYLYRIANELNNAIDTISTATYNYTSVRTRDVGRQDVKNSNAKFYATYIDAISNETVSGNITRTYTVPFDSEFKYPPIVTATPVNTGGPIGNDVLVVINSITTSTVTISVRFNSSGQVSNVSVNIIAIGLPAWYNEPLCLLAENVAVEFLSIECTMPRIISKHFA